MKINRLKIKGLFDLFDYDLDFTNEENLKIITGPNGFGKTMILNILYSLFNRQFSFFHKLVFEQIEVILENDYRVEITHQRSQSNRQFILMRLFEREQELPSSEIYTHSEKKTKKSKEFLSIVDSLRVHFIKEQRLFLQLKELRVSHRGKSLLSQKHNYSVLVNVVEQYSKELKSSIDNEQEKYSEISEELSADFSKRVLNFKEIISKDIVKSKIEKLEEKQKALKKYGLSSIELDIPTVDEINENDLKLLSVDLNDLEKKLSVFDDLLKKIKLFVDIVNRRLSFKHIEIHSKKGFICSNDKGKILSLEELSSGEQHQIVLLYELIFKTTENTLLLIDEPEISLHVAWQHDFIEDLKRIVELKNIQVIVATHAPAIINDHWDLVTDLFDESEKNQAK